MIKVAVIALALALAILAVVGLTTPAVSPAASNDLSLIQRIEVPTELLVQSTKEPVAILFYGRCSGCVDLGLLSSVSLPEKVEQVAVVFSDKDQKLSMKVKTIWDPAGEILPLSAAQFAPFAIVVWQRKIVSLSRQRFKTLREVHQWASTFAAHSL